MDVTTADKTTIKGEDVEGGGRYFANMTFKKKKVNHIKSF